MIQSKGTSTPQISLDGAVHYRLRDLAFPAYVALVVTLDPGIWVLVLNTGERGQERVFGKYSSPRCLAALGFSKDSGGRLGLNIIKTQFLNAEAAGPPPVS